MEEIKEASWPRVDLSVVFPKSLTCDEVGCWSVRQVVKQCFVGYIETVVVSCTLF